MSLAGRLINGLAVRNSTLANPSDALRSALVSTASYSGKSVTVESSLELVPVFAAVRRLSSALGGSPLQIFTMSGTRRVRAEDSRQWALLHDDPNPEQAADEFWAMVEHHIDLWGNAFIWKEPAPDGRVANLWGIKPSRMAVGWVKDKAGNTIKGYLLDGKTQLTGYDILHIRGLSSDGLVGYSPIQLARQQLGNAMAQEEFQGKFWANGAWPGVVLSHPNKITSEALANLKRTWKAAHGGYGRAGETAILEEGLKADTMTMPLEDAQFIEQSQFSDRRVAQMFDLPPSAIAAKGGDSMTYSTTEGEGINFMRWALRPRAIRIEQSLRRDPEILPPSLKLTPKFNLDAIVRADLKTRYEAHKIGIEAGFLTVDEARELEDRNPLETSLKGDLPDE